MRKNFTRYLVMASIMSLCTICACIYNTYINSTTNTNTDIDTASSQDKKKNSKNIEAIKNSEYGKNSDVYLYPSKYYIYPDFKNNNANKHRNTSGFYVYTDYKDIKDKECGYPSISAGPSFT